MKEENKKSLKSKIIDLLIVIVILVVGLFVYAKYIGTSGVRINETRISSEIIPSNFSGVKIVYFSDLLIGSVDIDKVKEVVEEINLTKPDIVLYGGDLINKGYKLKNSEDVIKELSKIQSTIGKYYTLGYLDEEESSKVLDQSGFTMLNDSELLYNEGMDPICLVGLNSYLLDLHNLDSFDKCAGLYTIVFTHEGDVLDSIKDKNVNVLLSGNSLGGEVNVPFIGPLNYFDGSKKYYESHYKVNDTLVYVSNGIGTKKNHMRLFNRPSINLFRLKSTGNN